MDRRCHYFVDRESGSRIFYPGCMGGAVYGISGCTCPPSPRRYNAIRLEKLADKCDKLADAVKRLSKEVRLFKKHKKVKPCPTVTPTPSVPG